MLVQPISGFCLDCQGCVEVETLTPVGQLSTVNPMKTTNPAPESKRHPIEVAARRSGLTKDVLRVWERRYGVVEPGRTDSGRRRYSDADVDRLTLLGKATAAGRPISLVAEMPTPELEALVHEDVVMGSVPDPTGAFSGVEQHVEACLNAIRLTDQDALRRVLRRAAIALPPASLIEEVVAPLMRRVGEQWWEQRLDPGQERLASQASREVLGDLIDAFQDAAERAPRLLTATPSRQRHELGAMLAAATGSSVGWHVTHLGSDIPVEDIARAATAVSADAVALSLVFPDDDTELSSDLHRLRGLLGDVPVVVGGRAAEAYADVLAEIGAYTASDLAEFRGQMERLAANPGRKPRPDLASGRDGA